MVSSPTDERDDAAAWEVVSPQRPSRVPGVSMAGFAIPSAAIRLVRTRP
jgi:hypothetical protein